MQKIAVLLDMDGPTVRESVKAVLSLAAACGPAVAVLTGVNTDIPPAVIETCGHYGIERIAVLCAQEDLEAQPDWKAAAIAEYLNKAGITDCIAIHSMEGKDLLGRLAALLEIAFAGDCLNIDLKTRTVKKSYFAGKALASLSMPEGIALYGLRPNALEATPASSPTNPLVEEIRVTVQSPANGIRILETAGDESGALDLSEASVIVSGGRALGSADNFALLRQLAEKLNAAVGASRAAVDAGYASHAMQVGQTGKTVSPNLYLACGISGAVQHYAGIKTAKVIVAINNDKDAPIFSKCNYGIVGDLFEIVPELIKTLG